MGLEVNEEGVNGRNSEMNMIQMHCMHVWITGDRGGRADGKVLRGRGGEQSQGNGVLGMSKRAAAHMDSQCLSQNSQDLYKIKPDKVLAQKGEVAKTPPVAQ